MTAAKGCEDMKTISDLIGTIYLTNGEEVGIQDSLLVSKRQAVRYVKRIRKKGCWVAYDDGSEEFVFPSDIQEIRLCRRANLTTVMEATT